MNPSALSVFFVLWASLAHCSASQPPSSLDPSWRIIRSIQRINKAAAKFDQDTHYLALDVVENPEDYNCALTFFHLDMFIERIGPELQRLALFSQQIVQFPHVYPLFQSQLSRLDELTAKIEHDCRRSLGSIVRRHRPANQISWKHLNHLSLYYLLARSEDQDSDL